MNHRVYLSSVCVWMAMAGAPAAAEEAKPDVLERAEIVEVEDVEVTELAAEPAPQPKFDFFVPGPHWEGTWERVLPAPGDNRIIWRQVAPGSTPGEVKVLLGEPREQTIDPALMGALGEQHWVALRGTVKEAWVYPLGWVVYFDDKGAVVEMLRRVSPLDVED